MFSYSLKLLEWIFILKSEISFLKIENEVIPFQD